MKILIVDDNDENRYLLETLLKGEGYEVLSARDGLEALDLLRSSRADLIISDILMPKMDGFQLCRAVRLEKDLKTIPFVFYTATYVSEKDRKFALSLGADRFLVKPDDMEKLGQTIKEIREKGASPVIQPLGDEMESFRQYNEILFLKLEKKVSDLEMARQELQKQLLERQRIEEALQASLQQMGAILNNIPDMAWLKDIDGRYIAVNVPYAEACQRKLQDIPGNTDLDIWPTDLARLYRLDDEEVMRTKQRKRVEERLIGPDGKQSWLETIKTPVFDRDGHVIGTTGIARDITERRRMEAEKALLEEQLLQAQKMEAIGQLAGEVAHDFNNILSAIVGYSTLATMNMKANDPNRENLEQILTSADRATTLTQSLLAFSRKQTINLERLDLNEIVNTFRKFLIRILPENINLQVVDAPEELPLTADRGQIEQMLMNLITNARDAIGENGRITIETAYMEMDDSFVKLHGLGEVGRYALLIVTDTGDGIPDDVKDKIFDPFFTTKEPGKGTGLGLSMVFGIVKKHKGYIHVFSEQGRGTTFKIYLPITHAPAKQDGKKTVDLVPLKGGTETILLAEDNDSLREMAITALSHFGYTVIQAVDGIDAVNQFAKNQDRIQLVILDCIMPKKSGREVSEEIRALNPNIKVIFFSGYAEEMIRSTGLSQKSEDFIQKPFSPSELVKRIRKMLDK